MHVLQSHCHRWALTLVTVDESIGAGSAVELVAAAPVVKEVVVAVVTLRAFIMTVVATVAATIATVVVAGAAILEIIPLMRVATLIGRQIRRLSL
jgi:hypothetical protein